jgi:hypothetical protein
MKAKTASTSATPAPTQQAAPSPATTSPTFFADRVTNLSVTGPLVRIELGVAQIPESENKVPQIVVSQTIVLPIEGFVNSFGMMEQVMKKLVETGVIKLRQGNEIPPVK